MSQVKFGLIACTQRPPRGEHMDVLVEEIVEEAQQAERHGFDSMMFTEHHQQADGFLPSPLILAAAVAAHTKRLKVGTAVVLLPLYHPIHLAEDAATLDIVSKGRLILGVAGGWATVDFQPFGVALKQRPSRVEEGVEIIKRAWTEERFSFHGKRYQLENVAVTPKPVQQPRPPIWMGGGSPAAIQRTAQIADRWITGAGLDFDTMKTLATAYRGAADGAGKAPFIASLRDSWVAPSMAQAAAEWGGPIMDTIGFYAGLGMRFRLAPLGRFADSPAELTFDNVKANRFVVGSPEDCRAEFERYNREAGVEYFVLRMRHPSGPSHEQTMAAIKLFGEQVIPYFRQ